MDENTKKAKMVSVSEKERTYRTAVASARVQLTPHVFELVKSNQLAKGSVMSVCQLAGIMAAKNTANTIPLCHPIALTRVDVNLSLLMEECVVVVEATVECVERTGVEMEAMCAASAAALTLYDMCKGADKGIVIERIQLESKMGGKSGTWNRD